MRDGRVHVRTIAGLKRADVLGAGSTPTSLDPLELNAASRLGVPGLIDDPAPGGVAVANMPGSGLSKSRALLGFLPASAGASSARICDAAISRPGGAARRRRARKCSRLDEMAIAGAFGRGVPGFDEPAAPVLAGELSQAERERLRGRDQRARHRLCRPGGGAAFDHAGLGATGRLAPRPFVLRVYAAATPDGWRVMPGGFCRISDQPDARAVSMGEGARVGRRLGALPTSRSRPTTLLPAPDNVRIRRMLGNLPSRAADNLFWFGRYLERAEATLRLVRCLRRAAARSRARARRTRCTRSSASSGCSLAWGAVSQAARTAAARRSIAEALRRGASTARRSSTAARGARTAASFRERLSPDTWQSSPNDRAGSRQEVEDDDGVVSAAELTLAGRLRAIAGLAQENINRVAGWSFLDIGRRIERGINTCRFARHSPATRRPPTISTSCST